MTHDDIMKLAREARLPSCHLTHPVALERFAALVAAAEREECAKVCEKDGLLWGQRYAAAIRSRT